MKMYRVFVALLAGLMWGETCRAAAPEVGAFRVASFNIRNPSDKPPNAWTCRVDRVRALIQRHRFDLMGVQEATARQIDDLLTEGWAHVGVCRDDGKLAGESAAIFYRKARFEVRDSGTFWLSETPEIPGSKSWGTACTRICTWARLMDLKDGTVFVHFNTHLDHISAAAREKGMALILRRMTKIAQGMPVILTGDMNAGPDSNPITLAKATLKDAKALSKSPHTGPFGTSNSFNFKKEKTSRIDYIFVSAGITVLTHATVDDSENGLYPSDHFPVAAEVLFEAVPPPEKILATLRTRHPRIMVDAKAFDALKAAIAQGGLSARLYATVKQSADKTLAAPVSIYEKPDGRRLLSVSRRVVDRVTELALVSRLENDPRYAERAWKELEAAARFPDWNPAHFLDTAEMTHAFALGYDWLFDHWSPEQRRILQDAIAEKGLKPGLKVYDSKKGWPRNNNNWNQVCNGGLISGALAIADVEPLVASRIVWEAVQSVPLPMRHYAPDGAGSEGVTYWSYAARYNVVLLSSLQTALGTDFGLSQVGAFGPSGFYQIYMCGAKRVAFDFADCSRTTLSTPQHFWLAHQYNVPAFCWFRRSTIETVLKEGAGLWDLIWLDTRGTEADITSLPLDKHFRGVECASLRTSWAPDALIVGIQAGDSMNLGGHRHLDLGSFIVDALGERWITDSGKERETYMGHQHHNPREAYYRIRAEGHNVPVLNPGKGVDQNPKAIAKISEFTSTPQQVVAMVDLSQAYQPHVSRLLRTFTLQDRKRLLVTDEITAIKPSELWWFLHTEAKVTLGDNNRTATLSQKGKTFTIRLVEPTDGVFSVMACEPLPTSPNPEKQTSNRDLQKLALHLKGIQSTRVQVVMEP